MNDLPLAIASVLPLIYLRTDDTINVEEVLNHYTGGLSDPDMKVQLISLPESIKDMDALKMPANRYMYTSSDTKSMGKVYRWAADNDRCVIFVNTEKSALQYDGGALYPPKEVILSYLKALGVIDAGQEEALLPSLGGLTLKEVGEIAKMTMTRDGSITPKGVADTRRGYDKLQGITQVATDQSYYVAPQELEVWLKSNTDFFLNPKHPSLTPRGLLFDGPPGTGKTTASKYIAQTFGIPLYRMDLGAMMGKYVGESENNLSSALAQLDQVEPCVAILDEVEKLFQGTGGDSGVTSRLLGQLLWWLQEHKSKVFTVMTTNKKSAIPPELYREGRIDKVMQFLGIPGYTEGYAFAKGALDAMLAEMNTEATPDVYTALQKRIKGMYNSDLPVPQSKLTQATYALVREYLTQPTEVAKEEPKPPKGKIKLVAAKQA